MIANSTAPKTRAYGRRLFNIWALGVSACALFLAGGPIIGLGGVAPASAQTPSATPARNAFKFDIPAQPLDTALAKFGEVTGIQIVYDSGVSRTLRSKRGERQHVVTGRAVPYTGIDGPVTALYR